MTVSGFSTIETASIAAASGRQRNAISHELSASFRAAGSLRISSGRVTSSKSPREESLSKILSPVVPALPSMKIFFILNSLQILSILIGELVVNAARLCVDFFDFTF